MTAPALAAREGRPSIAGLQASLAQARDVNVNLALELRAERDESRRWASHIAAAADYISNPARAEDAFTVIQVAQAISGAARRRLAQLGAVTL